MIAFFQKIQYHFGIRVIKLRNKDKTKSKHTQGQR